MGDRDKKYDRQLRLWGDHGQQCLENSRVCLINVTATGTETLKNLVLPGLLFIKFCFLKLIDYIFYNLIKFFVFTFVNKLFTTFDTFLFYTHLGIFSLLLCIHYLYFFKCCFSNGLVILLYVCLLGYINNSFKS